jgi:glycosyltransferase involved in cell wall biosynthesis
MKVALVYDRINKWGGAERILLALHELYPEAPLFTALYNPKTASWANQFAIRPSFINRLFGGMGHEFLAWLTPLAFESFDFSDFDIVISVTSAEAKNIITHPGTLHICYCLTPTRYLWSGQVEYLKNPGLGMMSPLVSYFFNKWSNILRRWDMIAASRPDKYIAISKTVKKRIVEYYHRVDVGVIYPPVDITHFRDKQKQTGLPKDYYLVVSRLVSYKRVDLAVLAFNRLNLPLVIIGKGRELDTLKKIAQNNIIFQDKDLTDTELVHYYNSCRALIFAGTEDFGLVMVETQAAGKPVIAYNRGGSSEIIIHGKTGILFNEQTISSLMEAVRQSQKMNFDENLCRQNALKFAKVRFNTALSNEIEKQWFLYNERMKKI